MRLYAWALDKQLRAQNVSQMTEEVIREVAANGTAIIETIIQLNKYQSISGATIKIDRHGDSEGNFSVLAFKNAPPVNITHNISCSQYLVPVASFLQGDNDMPVSESPFFFLYVCVSFRLCGGFGFRFFYRRFFCLVSILYHRPP